jgi:hypothetical protein
MKRITLFLLLALTAAPAWAAKYAYSGTITVPHTSVSQLDSADFSNYTAYVKLADPTFCATGGGTGQIQHSGNANSLGATVPYDLIFTTDSAGLSLMSWEVYGWDTSGCPTSANVWAAVKVTTLSYSASPAFTFYVFYGNTGTTTWQGGVLGAAYDSYTKGVWHLGNGSTLSRYNSITGVLATYNGYNKYPAASATAELGQGSALYVANDTSILLSDITPNDDTGITLSTWTYPTSIASGSFLFCKRTSGDMFEFYYQYGTQLSFVTHFSGTYGGWHVALPSLNNWHNLAVSYSGASASNKPVIYVDGTAPSLSTDSTPTGTASTNSDSIAIGNSNFSYSNAIGGNLEEVRMDVGIQRSAGWVQTVYNNQSAIATFSGVSGLGACSGSCGQAGGATIMMTPIIF